MKKLSLILKAFLFETSKIDESVVLVLRILKPEFIDFLVFLVPLDRVSSTGGMVGVAPGNFMSNHPIVLGADTLTSQTLLMFSLFADNVKIINP